MHIEDRLAAIEEKLEAILQAISGEATTEDVEDPPPAKKTKAKADPEPPPVASKGKKKAKAPEVTIDDLRVACVAIAKSDDEGKEKIVAALQRHGADRLGELPVERYADFQAMLKKITDEGLDPRDSIEETDEEEDF